MDDEKLKELFSKYGKKCHMAGHQLHLFKMTDLAVIILRACPQYPGHDG